MNSHLFTFTNHKTERNSNFFSLFDEKDKTYVNLMGKNKLNSKTASILLYPLFFVLLLPFSIFKLIKNRNVENYLVLFPGILELLILRTFKPIFKFKIVYDMFTSFHLTLIEDRKIIKSGTLLERVVIFLDKLFFTIPDKLIFETSEMEEYVQNFLGLEKENSLVLTSYRELPLGLDIDNSIDKEDSVYTITFWGSFERMHGLDTILDSAIELGNEYKFYLIGDGSYFKHIKARIEEENIKNVFLTGYLSKNVGDNDNLYSYIIKSDICLGAFSNTKKNNLVIPGKIVEAFLFEKPVITAKTDYIKNNCSDSLLPVQPDSSNELANAIKKLSIDSKLREDIVIKSKNYFKSNHSKAYFQNALLEFLA